MNSKKTNKQTPIEIVSAVYEAIISELGCD